MTAWTAISRDIGLVARRWERRVPRYTTRAAMCLVTMMLLRHGLDSHAVGVTALTVLSLATIIIVGALQAVSAILRGATAIAASTLVQGWATALQSPQSRATAASALAAHTPWLMLVGWAVEAMLLSGNHATVPAMAVDINLLGFGCAIALGFEPPVIGPRAKRRSRQYRGKI